MEGIRIIIDGRWFRALNIANKQRTHYRYFDVRLVGKAPDRAAVHGSRLPVTTTIANEEETREAIEKGKEEKEQKRKEVEKNVESQIDSSGGDTAARNH